MAFTRAQATELLNKAEMQLYDDSRANGLRGLDRAALAGRVARTRAARDRARDLLRRQRLAARKRGAGKADDIAARTADKEALLVEILQRFVQARRDAPVAAKKAVAKKVTAETATTTKAGAKKASATKATAKKAAAKKTTAKKTTAKKTTAKKTTAKKTTAKTAVSMASDPARKPPAKKTSARKRPAEGPGATRKTATTPPEPGTPTTRGGDGAARNPGVSARRALSNTRKLLEAKQERDRTPQPWQSLDPAVEHVPQAGYQSPQAASKAHALHAGESRMASIHGSMAARDRRNQGQRDHRGDDD